MWVIPPSGLRAWTELKGEGSAEKRWIRQACWHHFNPWNLGKDGETQLSRGGLWPPHTCQGTCAHIHVHHTHCSNKREKCGLDPSIHCSGVLDVYSAQQAASHSCHHGSLIMLDRLLELRVKVNSFFLQSPLSGALSRSQQKQQYTTLKTFALLWKWCLSKLRIGLWMDHRVHSSEDLAFWKMPMSVTVLKMDCTLHLPSQGVCVCHFHHLRDPRRQFWAMQHLQGQISFPPRHQATSWPIPPYRLNHYDTQVIS